MIKPIFYLLLSMKPNIKLEDFLDYFPSIELPITLSENSISHIEKTSKIIPEPILDMTIRKWEKVDPDGFTEYVPCFTLAKSENFILLVYWKASLSGFEYFAVTLGYDFQLIDRKQIASTLHIRDQIKSSVVHIDEDLTFHVIASIDGVTANSFNPSNSQAFHFEVNPSGEFIFTKEDYLV